MPSCINLPFRRLSKSRRQVGYIVILFLCTIPLYFCRMIGWKDDAIRLYDVILYGMESQEGDSLGEIGFTTKDMTEAEFEKAAAQIEVRNRIRLG